MIVAPATGKFGGGAVTTALTMSASVIACGRNAETLNTMSTSFSSTGRLSTALLTGDVATDTEVMISTSNNGSKGPDAYIHFYPAAVAKSTICARCAQVEGKSTFYG